MNETNNSILTPYAQKLRRNMTKEEKHLWYDLLKKLPKSFNRQKVIGNYIADFYCAAYKLVIEVDGSQHYSEEGRDSDKERDAYMKSLGLKVLRYSNADINLRFDAIKQDILNNLV